MCRIITIYCRRGTLQNELHYSCENQDRQYRCQVSFDLYHANGEASLTGYTEKLVEHVYTIELRIDSTISCSKICCQSKKSQPVEDCLENTSNSTWRARCGCEVNATNPIFIAAPGPGITLHLEYRSCIEVGPRCDQCEAKTGSDGSLANFKDLEIGEQESS